MKFPPIDHFITGVAVPVFSLRSQASCGIGEFADLVPFGMWCRRVGLDLIQVLPVNDTGLDPSPYNAQSAFALNPIYIRLEDVPGWEICAEEIRIARREFETLDRVQYQEVCRFKIGVLRRIYAKNQIDIAADVGFRQWVDQNSWLEAYLKFLDGTHSLFPAWVQFHLDRQLHAAALRLDAMGIALKGDIPILLSLDSADCKYNSSFFNKDLRVGAPPDMFCREGQNWRFPSFRWDEMERAGFNWWRDRLQRASRFYHAYRIDHVLGFFRTWTIPEAEESAAHGYYEPAKRIGLEQLLDDAELSELEIEDLVQSRALIRTDRGFAPAWYWRESPAHNRLDEIRKARLHSLIEHFWTEQDELWRETGRRLLDAIAKSTDMLVCGEDLGVVPTCVPEVLEELGILGLRVERWADSHGRLMTPDLFPRLTVSTTSTHDSSTLRGWWQEPHWDRSEYFKMLNIAGDCPEYLTTEVCAAILKRNLSSNSLIVVLPLQDLFALHYDLRVLDPAKERVNVPGLQGEENWTYRMKPSIETLLAYDRFNDYLAEFISQRRNKTLGASARA